MRFGTAARLLVALAACGVGLAAADGKEMNAATDRAFSFGPMAIGQAKDLDHARAEGLGVVPASPLDTYLGGVLAKLLAGSPVTQVPARVYVRASSEWSPAARRSFSSGIADTLASGSAFFARNPGRSRSG